MPKKIHDIETLPGRMLMGRVGGAMQWVSTYADLNAAAGRLVPLFERDDDGKTLWGIHILFIRHDGGVAEQLLQIDPDFLEVDKADKAGQVAEEVAQVMERLRGCNVNADPVRHPPPEPLPAVGLRPRPDNEDDDREIGELEDRDRES